MIYALQGVSPRIHSTAFIAPSADVIGDVEIGENASLWFNVTARGDVNAIKIGHNSNIQDNSVLHGTYKKWSLTVGSGVSVGHSVTLHGCIIGDHCLIGMGATIMDGAEIGEECLIGAHALVTQGTKIPPRSLVMGAPAKVVRPLKPEEIKSIYDSRDRYKMYIEWYRTSGIRGAEVATP